MTRSFKWLPHDGKRHAVPRELLPGDEGETLCAAEVVIPRQLTKLEWCWPECPDCDRTWRAAEGIRQR